MVSHSICVEDLDAVSKVLQMYTYAGPVRDIEMRQVKCNARCRRDDGIICESTT